MSAQPQQGNTSAADKTMAKLEKQQKGHAQKTAEVDSEGEEGAAATGEKKQSKAARRRARRRDARQKGAEKELVEALDSLSEVTGVGDQAAPASKEDESAAAAPASANPVDPYSLLASFTGQTWPSDREFALAPVQQSSWAIQYAS